MTFSPKGYYHDPDTGEWIETTECPRCADWGRLTVWSFGQHLANGIRHYPVKHPRPEDGELGRYMVAMSKVVFVACTCVKGNPFRETHVTYDADRMIVAKGIGRQHLIEQARDDPRVMDLDWRLTARRSVGGAA